MKTVTALLHRFLATLCALVLSCAASAEPLRVEYGDCAAVLDGPRCVLNDERTLRLWVRAAPGAQLNLDDGRRELKILQRYDVDGGTHMQVEVPTRSRRIRVLARDATNTETWSIELASLVRAPQLDNFRDLFLGGQFDAAEALLQTLIDDPDFEQRCGALRMTAVFYHNRGAPEKAKAFYPQAVTTCLREGRWLEAVKAASAQSYLLQHTFRDFAAARASFAAFADLHNAPAEVLYFEHYDLGLLGFNTGDRRAALTRLDAAARQAMHLGDSNRWLQRRLDAEEILASQLQRLGRRAQAKAYFDAWQARDLSGLDACERAYFFSNAAWNALLILEAGDSVDDPTEQLQAALAIMRENCKPWDVAGAEINLALAHYHAGRYDAATDALERARNATETPELRLRFWELDIEARLAAERGNTDVALALLEGMNTLANATLSPDAAWRSNARRGLILEQLGNTSEAINAYLIAENALSRDLQRVPFFAGRGQFAASREWVMRRRLALLHARGENREIARLVRVTSRRQFDALATQTLPAATDPARARYDELRGELADQIGQGWRVPADELALLQAQRAERQRELLDLLDIAVSDVAPPNLLPAVASDDVLLGFHPLIDGWIVAAVAGDNVAVEAPDCPDDAESPRAIAQCLLDAIAPTLHSAKRVRIVPSGKLLNVDFHTLTLGDATLLDAHPVIYTLDIAPDIAEPAFGLHALIVGDPTRQLPASRKEALAVDDLLKATGRFSVQTVTGREANFATVRAALADADVFHFAGHATYESHHAWASALALANRDALSIADVLSLPHAPDFVMLSACDTARVDSNNQNGALGLAQAFALRGARHVVATARPVSDAQAGAFSRAFYQHWQSGATPEVALQRARNALREADTTGDWAAFRLITP